jgi:Iap family predicted aminopeptidase
VWYFAGRMTKEQVKATDAMVNIDSLGLGHPTVWPCQNTLSGMLLSLARGLKVEVECGPKDYVIFDSESFSERRVPSISITSLTQKTYEAQIVRSASDKISAVHFDDYYETYKLLAAC